MNSVSWYSAKCIFRHSDLPAETGGAFYEERIVLFRVADFNDAIAKAEADAAEYCSDSPNVVYLGFVDVYRWIEETVAEGVGHGTEVYSLMRESKLSDHDYLDRFHDDGNERTQIEV